MDNNQTNTCAVCGGNFNSHQGLEEHAKQAHSNGSEHEQQEHSISCSKCGIKVKSADDLAGHELHHNE